MRTIIFTISFGAILFVDTSCDNNLKKVETQKKEIEIQNSSNENEISGNSFEPGLWKIDSVAENKVVIDRLLNDSEIQVFNFRKHGIFSMLKITERTTKDEVLGKWVMNKDSLLIVNNSGEIVMRYGFEISKSNMILNSGFEISSTNKNKPTFYLSKYKEKPKANIFGPSR